MTAGLAAWMNNTSLMCGHIPSYQNHNCILILMENETNIHFPCRSKPLISLDVTSDEWHALICI